MRGNPFARPPGWGMAELAHDVGVEPRLWSGWRNGRRGPDGVVTGGDRPLVNPDRADEVLQRTHLNWWDVYNPDTVRRPVLVVRHYGHLERRKRSGESRGFFRVLRATEQVGDAGPDGRELERIGRLMDGLCPGCGSARSCECP